MGFQARKSFKVVPGVRMTVSKSGLSTSVGAKGARVTRTASGRTTRTVGIPGSGISHTKTIGSATSQSRGASPRGTQPAAPPPAPVKPGLTAPRWEKDLYRAITDNRIGDLAGIGHTSPDAAPVAAVVEGFAAFQAGNHERATALLDWVWRYGGPIESHAFMQKYLSASMVTLGIAQGVTVTMPLNRDAVGLALAELHQEGSRPEFAIQIVEQLEPSVIAAVSLAELYIQSGRFQETVDITNGITNVDDPSALLLTFRGVALRELGHCTASREALKGALKSTKRDAGIRHLALLERAKTYKAEGKAAMARKDLEKVLAEDASFPGVAEALAET